MFFVFLVFALFSTVFVISKVGLLYSQPLFFLGSRMILAGVLFVGYQLFKDFTQLKIFKTHFWKIICLALFNIYLANLFEFLGLQYLPSYKTSFIYSFSPFISALFSFFIFSEKMNFKKWSGLLIGFFGFLFIFFKESDATAQGYLFSFSWPEVSVMFAAISSVYGWILLCQLVKEAACSPLMANGLSMLIGGGFAIAHSAIVEEWNPLPVSEFLPFLKFTLLLVLISNLICYNLYGSLLKRFSPTFMSFAGFTTPIFTALFGWIFLDEMLTWSIGISFLTIILGLLMFYQEELKSNYLTSSYST